MTMKSSLKGKEIYDESQSHSSIDEISIVSTYYSDSDLEDHASGESSVTTAETNEQPKVSQHGLTVMGLYGRAPMPRLDQLPEGYSDKDKDPDQFMPRRRLNTKPIYEDFDNANSDNGDGNREENETSYDEAMFEPVKGLVNNNFWHMDPNKFGYLYGDRAVLFQAVEHYDKLAQVPQFASCFDDYLTSPYFGEQVIVKGFDSSQLAIGDVFEVENDLSTLVVEITSPRKPCFYVDKRNNTSMGSKGMKRHTLTEGLAGWFTRVLVAGELRDGMKLVRTKHPNPKWTLTRLSKVLYGEGNKVAQLACKAAWSREKEELVELLNLPQLGEFEWKEDARKILWQMEKKEAKPSRFSFFMRRTPVDVKVTVKGIYGHEEEIEEIEVTVKGVVIEKFTRMGRARYITTPLNKKKQEDDEEAFFVPNRGLMYEKFWHNSDENLNNGVIHGDRAVLFQSTAHYETLAKDPKFATCFENGKYDYISNPTFGEQVIIEGCDASEIAVGDVFEVEGKKSSLMVEISAPRKPGDVVDINHHGQVMGANGMKRHCLNNGLSGWFTRVLVAGELRDGMKLIRTRHPNPKWTLKYTANSLYSEGETAYWKNEKEELLELVNLPQLGERHWKAEGIKILNNFDDRYVEEVEDTSNQGYLAWFISFATGASGCYCNSLDNFTACGQGLDNHD